MARESTIGYLKMSPDEQLQLAIPLEVEILEAQTRQVQEVEVFAESKEVEATRDES